MAAPMASWTLESAAQRVLEVAPERHVAEAEVHSREGVLVQSDLWSNPSVDFGVDNSLGKQDGRGGNDLTRVIITQPLPLSGRLGFRRKQADAGLRQAEAEAGQQRLILEHQAAYAFHGLQMNRALYQLAEQRLQTADEFQNIGRRREQAGDLSRLERLRLDIVREKAKQMIASAEGEYSESLSHFQTLLNISETEPQLLALDQLPTLPELAVLEQHLELHPAMVAAREGIEAARHGVDLARANRFADPALWVAHERSFLAERRQDVNAIGVIVTLPLWDQGKGHIDTAQAAREKAQFEQEALRRQLTSRLHLTHMHLGHLIEQAQEYRVTVLEPAGEVFQLTRKGFAAGQVDILNLVDAVETYFTARSRYLELVQGAWLEAAELRRAAGISLLSSNSEGAAQ